MTVVTAAGRRASAAGSSRHAATGNGSPFAGTAFCAAFKPTGKIVRLCAPRTSDRHLAIALCFRLARRHPGINEIPVEDELFLIVGDSGNIYHLDCLAMSIWRGLEEPAGMGGFLALLQDAFPETLAGAIERDLKGAITTSLRGELIEV
jgi:hypothetical protein